LPLVDMGERAMSMALDEGSGKQQRVVRFETALVVRDSTGPARA
jgi:DNA-binding LacI/PurR family transcriptional regulator